VVPDSHSTVLRRPVQNTRQAQRQVSPATRDQCERRSGINSRGQKQYAFATCARNERKYDSGSVDPGRSFNTEVEDYQRARLLQKSRSLDQDSDSESSDVEEKKQQICPSSPKKKAVN